MNINTTVAGIPAVVRVTHFLEVKPWRGPACSCPSDWDYYGYTEIEFEVCDRRGRSAPWLERKLSDTERERIDQEVIDAHKQEQERNF